MDEYARSIIERYCRTHRTKKAEFLEEMLEIADAMEALDECLCM